MADEEEIARRVVEKIKPQPLTPDKVRDRNLNPRPETALEISSSLIEVKSGRNRLGADLAKRYKFKHPDSDDELDANDFLTTITTDIRLSNLGAPKDNSWEIEFTRWAMKLHLRCLQHNLPKSASRANQLILSITEPSLGRNMALRKGLQTIQQKSEHIQIEEPPPKQSLIQKLTNRGNR